ncbi:hypothetical protein GGR51DRAFT_446113 [Nemania sp. FL0031]|nr:hypothetical protein GGR51DRAFT_446113 [Nemania sp. FL0031]
MRVYTLNHHIWTRLFPSSPYGWLPDRGAQEAGEHLTALWRITPHTTPLLTGRDQSRATQVGNTGTPQSASIETKSEQTLLDTAPGSSYIAIEPVNHLSYFAHSTESLYTRNDLFCVVFPLVAVIYFGLFCHADLRIVDLSTTPRHGVGAGNC